MKSCLFFIILVISLFDCIQSLKPSDCRCRLNSSPKVIGGNQAAKGKYPWMISIGEIEVSEQVYDSSDYLVQAQEVRQETSINRMLKTHVCSGFVINEKWALTSAHCRSGTFLGVGTGDSLREIYLNGRRKIKRFISHPLYEEYSSLHDIALVELETELILNDHLHPACLPSRDYELESRQNVLFMAGFGDIRSEMFFSLATNNNDNVQEEPKSLQPGVPTNRLKELYFYRKNQAEQLCASGQVFCLEALEGKGSSTGQGDSGAPLMLTMKGQTVVIGVDSSTRTLNNFIHRLKLHSGSMNYFTNVHLNMNFILQHLTIDQMCRL